MSISSYTTINLGLPDIPETTDPTLFKELVRVYNAIKLLAQGVDNYTDSGNLISQVEDGDLGTQVTLDTFKRQLITILNEIDNLPKIDANFSELRKQYYRYTVPKFTVTTDLNVKQKFSLGDPISIPPIGVQTITKFSGTSPAGGIGTVAGAWDTAANRDSAIAAINQNALAITEIQNFLTLFGFLKV